MSNNHNHQALDDGPEETEVVRIPVRYRDVDENGRVNIGFWLKIAATVFGAWAVMLPLGIWIIQRGLEQTSRDFTEARAREESRANALLQTDLDINRRLYTLEAEHGDVKRRLSIIEDVTRQHDRQISELQRLETQRLDGGGRSTR